MEKQNENLTIQKKLFLLADKKYARFQSSLVPSVSCEKIIGVRVPVLRKFAKELLKSKNDVDCFLRNLPHQFYDENVLHALLISAIADFNECICTLEIFLPHIDNWAVCDLLSPKVFRNHKPTLLKKIKMWILSSHAFTKRFAIDMLIEHFLDCDFKPNYLSLVANVCDKNYYVEKAAAWFFATALSKQWNETLPFLENKRLSARVHNFTIQKATESFRLSKKQKSFLKTLKC